MALTIREYTARDSAAVRELMASVLAEYGFRPEMAGPQHPAEADDGRGGGQAGFWVAELDGDVVGTVAVRPKDQGACELKRLYVRSSARGHGLGGALYAHAEAFARAAGYERVWLLSSRRFKEARRLYERRGFTLVEQLDNDWEDNVYEKRLSVDPSPAST